MSDQAWKVGDEAPDPPAPRSLTDLHAAITAHLNEQEHVGWHLDWPEALEAIRVVVEMHAPDPWGWCNHCGQTCPTMQAIADKLGPDVWVDWEEAKKDGAA